MRSWLSNNPLYYPKFAPVLLIAVILAGYYPAMLSGIHPVDDPGIFTRYSESLPLSQVIFPGSSYYYRPIIELSFWLDNRLWGMESTTMHLENILLHVANTLLIFHLARWISREDEPSFIPLLAALLFALHPVNVEAVAWIAGRTDPLLALFVLSSLIYWLRWLATPRWQDITAALLLFGAALLTKETALAFGAVVVLFVMIWPGTATFRQRILAAGLMVLPVALLVIMTLIFQNGTSGLSRFLAGTSLHMGHGIRGGMVAFGFYVKKLIVPYPLNFAIDQVQPAYAMVILVLIPLLWLLVRRYRLASIFFISALLFMLPAVLVAVTQIAWTPLAERYLYIPSAFFMIGLSITASSFCSNQKKILYSTALCLAGCFAVISIQRTLLWNDKLAFFQDAVVKSPGFGSVYNSLGGQLLQNGQVDRAAEAFATADRLNRRDSIRTRIKAAIMTTKLVKGDLLEARSYFFEVFPKKMDASADFLELLYKADGKRIGNLIDKDKVLLANDLLETLKLLNQKKPDPFWLYRSGQISLIIGDAAKSADFFRRAYTAAPVDAHYKGAAKTYLLRLESSR
ncbi:MAG: glycosyltransferase family 39 protein [Desulfuromonadaceae bacterium]|nr:glycosyltransferase family 39 protein [Desulfuromonadaceae bacterium]MDD5106385.1 glycosyltransferase family 39 protein [Desulfuromonadaceae bacterium]